jgi:26S proteasome regulatory subunit N2
MSTVLSTVNHFIQLLNEEDIQLQTLALDKLLQVVDAHWPEISNILPKLEAMYEENFSQKEKVAFLISKVYYHLEEYDESVEYALASRALFDIRSKSTFVDCIISKGLDSYVKQR